MGNQPVGTYCQTYYNDNPDRSELIFAEIKKNKQSDAKAFCAQNGQSLVSVHSEEKRNLFGCACRRQLQENSDADYCWLGLVRKEGATNMLDWEWEDSGMMLNNENNQKMYGSLKSWNAQDGAGGPWGQGQPNLSKLNKQFCAVMYRDLTWHDIRCSGNDRFGLAMCGARRDAE